MRLLLALSTLLLGLSAKPAAHDQTTPVWTDDFGALPTAGDLTGVTVGPSGEQVVFGRASAGDGLQTEAYLARLDGGEVVWSARYAAPQPGADLNPVDAVVAGDSVRVALVTGRAESQIGQVYLQSVSLATGEAGALRSVSLPGGGFFNAYVARAVPGSEDVLLGGLRFDVHSADDFDVFAYVARVRPDGTVAWFNDDLRGPDAEISYGNVLDVRVAGARVYVDGGERDGALAELDLLSGEQTRALAFPTEAFGTGAYATREDTLYYSVLEFDRLLVAYVTADTLALFADVPFEPSNRLSAVYEMRADAAGVSMFGPGAGPGGSALRRVSVGLNGGVTVSLASGDPDFQSTSLFTSRPREAALSLAGELLVVGRRASVNGSREGALIAYDFDERGTATIVYTYGSSAGQAYTYPLDLIPHGDGGALSVYIDETGDEDVFRSRRYGLDGAVLADTALLPEESVETYLGAAPVAGGETVAIVYARATGFVALRIGADGLTQQTAPLDLAFGGVFIDGDRVRSLPDGRVLMFYLAGDPGEAYNELLILDERLRIRDAIPLEPVDSIGGVDEVLPVPNSTDLLVHGTYSVPTGGGIYLTRVTADGDIVWRWSSTRYINVFERLGFTDEGEVYAVSQGHLGRFFDAGTGELLRERRYPKPVGSTDTDDVCALGNAPVYVTGQLATEAPDGLLSRDIAVSLLDFASGTYQTLATVSGPDIRIAEQYRERDGRTFLQGVTLGAFGERVFVLAFEGALSPTAEAVANVAPLRLSPNPAASGGLLSAAKDVAPASLDLYDATGRRIARVPATGEATGTASQQYRLPPLPPGTYFAEGRDTAGVRRGATVVVR